MIIVFPFSSKNIKKNDEVDDLIRLGRKCNQINYWRFPPRMTRCPSHRCTLDFGNRATAIRHFRKWHADAYILCSFCAKPVYAPTIGKLKAHFKRVHPLYSIENDTNNGDLQTLDVCNLNYILLDRLDRQDVIHFYLHVIGADGSRDK